MIHVNLTEARIIVNIPDWKDTEHLRNSIAVKRYSYYHLIHILNDLESLSLIDKMKRGRIVYWKARSDAVVKAVGIINDHIGSKAIRNNNNGLELWCRR